MISTRLLVDGGDGSRAIAAELYERGHRVSRLVGGSALEPNGERTRSGPPMEGRLARIGRAISATARALTVPRPDVAYVDQSLPAAIVASFLLTWLRGVPVVDGREDLSFLWGPDSQEDRQSPVERLEKILRVGSFARPRFDLLTRACDAVLSAIGLALLALPLTAAAVAVRATMGGPVFYSQDRPGRYAQPFRMYKIRTMRNSQGGDAVELPDIDRLTGVGAFLRRSSLDEVPELWNVLRGDMALVGPRPLLPRYTAFFTEAERERFTVRPGVTGLAQVEGRNHAPWDTRLRLDVEYVRHRSALLNVKVLARTVGGVLGARGVVVDPESHMKNLDDERRDSA